MDRCRALRITVKEDHGSLSPAEAPPAGRLKEYYDGARNKLKTYLNRGEGVMGSGSSTQSRAPAGGTMFQPRPPVLAAPRFQNENDHGDHFTDISYSDLSFIVAPHTSKTCATRGLGPQCGGKVSTHNSKPDSHNIINNNNNNDINDKDDGYMDDGGWDGDVVSSRVTPPIIPSPTTVTAAPTLTSPSTAPRVALPEDMATHNLRDLMLEEITT